MSNLVFYVDFTKKSLRKIHSEMLGNQLEQFKERILKDVRKKKGWRMCYGTPVEEAVKVTEVEKNEETGEESEVTKDGFAYHVKYHLICRPKGKRLEAIVRDEFEEILKILSKTSRSKKWSVTGSGETDHYPGPDDEVVVPSDDSPVDEGDSPVLDGDPVQEGDTSEGSVAVDDPVAV